MSKLATTKMSSRGQVVIPEKIRKRMNLSAGSQFIVMSEGDVVILKRITAPATEEYRGLIERVRAKAATADWPQNYFEETYGVQATDPIERPSQGDYPERDVLK